MAGIPFKMWKYPLFLYVFVLGMLVLKHLYRSGTNLGCHDVTHVDLGVRSGCLSNVTEIKAIFLIFHLFTYYFTHFGHFSSFGCFISLVMFRSFQLFHFVTSGLSTCALSWTWSDSLCHMEINLCSSKDWIVLNSELKTFAILTDEKCFQTASSSCSNGWIIQSSEQITPAAIWMAFVSILNTRQTIF